MARKQAETRFKEKIRPLLEAIPFSYWIKTQQRTVRGVPDFVGTVGGWSVWLELKTSTGEPDKLQLHRIRKLTWCGAYARVVAPENLQEVLRELKNLPMLSLKRELINSHKT